MPGELFDIRAELAPGEAKEVGFNIRGIEVTYDAGTSKLTCMGKSGDLGLEAGKMNNSPIQGDPKMENTGHCLQNCQMHFMLSRMT